MQPWRRRRPRPRSRAGGLEGCGGVVVSAAGKNIGDLVVDRKEALDLPRRLEPLHDPLSSSGWLMGVLGPVVETFVLSVLDAGHDLPLGGGVALQLVGDEHTRCPTLLLEELAEQAFGGLRVAPALDEEIENEAILVDGTPKPMLLPGDADDDLVEVPLVATARRSPTDAVGEFPAEFRLHCRIVSCVTDMPRAASISSTIRRLSGVAMASVNRVSRRLHPAQLPDQPSSCQACSRPT